MSYNDKKFIKFVLTPILTKLDEKSKYFSENSFAFRQIEDLDFKEAKKEFELILKKDLKDFDSNLGLDIIKMFNLSIDNYDDNANGELIQKYVGDIKDALILINANLKLTIGIQMYYYGLQYSMTKRQQVLEANQKLAGATLSASLASMTKNKKLKTLGYGIAGAQGYGSVSVLSDSYQTENLEVTYMNAAFSICTEATSNIILIDNKRVLDEYLDNFYKIKVNELINKIHLLLKLEYKENNKWGLYSNYKEKIDSKLLLHHNNFNQLLDYFGLDNHDLYRNKNKFDDYLKLFLKNSKKMKLLDTLLVVLNVVFFILMFVWAFIVLINEMPTILIVIPIIFEFFLNFKLVKHKDHHEMKEKFLAIKKHIDNAQFSVDDIQKDKIGLS